MNSMSLTEDDLSKETDAEIRKARNRIAQRNYRKNIKDRLRELELLRAREAATKPTNSNKASQRSTQINTPNVPNDRNTGQSRAHFSLTPRSSDNISISGEVALSSSIQPLHSPIQQSSEGGNTISELDWAETHVLQSPPLTCNHTVSEGGEKGTKMDHSMLVELAPSHSTNCTEQLSTEPFLPGRTPLHQAAARGHLRVVQLLVEKGANIHAIDEDGQTILQLASRNGHEDIVRYVLEQGAPVETYDSSGYTALHLAAEHGWENIVKMLLEAGAYIDAVVSMF